MAYNFVDIVNDVLLEIDEPEVEASTAGFVTAATTNKELRRVKRYVQMIYQTIYMMNKDFPWCRLVQEFDTVVNQASYEVSDLDALTDMNNLYYLQMGDSDPMRLRHYSTAKKNTAYSGMAYVLDDKLTFLSTPKTVETYTLIGKKKFTQLVAHDDAPLIPEELRQVLYYGAAWMAKEHDNEQSHYAALYQQAVDSLIAGCDNAHDGFMPHCDDSYY